MFTLTLCVDETLCQDDILMYFLGGKGPVKIVETYYLFDKFETYYLVRVGLTLDLGAPGSICIDYNYC